MPVISQFYGILIYMYREIGGHHNEPHIHIKYNEYEMSITIKGKSFKWKITKETKKVSRCMDGITQRRITSCMVCFE